jgi:FMN phosphatase YigB (HAD superfamily)
VPNKPAALLLDFGGVLGERKPGVPSRPQRLDPFVADLYQRIDGAVSAGDIKADLLAAGIAYGRYCEAMARPRSAREVSHAEFWGDYVAADWPEAARATVIADADELSYRWVDGRTIWRLRPGAREVLQLAHGAGIPMSVVSNVLCGAPVRDFLAQEGVGGLFTAQIYSDELGYRKPSPEMVMAAADALGVAPADCWFVGDMPLRDVLACRRAGVGYVILVDSDQELPGADPTPMSTPDIAVASMVDVAGLLRSMLA